jgi:hypothetical protein
MSFILTNFVLFSQFFCYTHLLLSGKKIQEENFVKHLVTTPLWPLLLLLL